MLSDIRWCINFIQGELNALGFTTTNVLLIGKVFGHGLIEAGSWQEDPERAEDNEEGEGNQTESVDDSRRKSPLITHGHLVVLVPVAFGNKVHLIQDPGQLWLHAGPRGAASGREELLSLTWSWHCGVRHGVKHVAIVGPGGTGFELNAAQAGLLAIVGASWARSGLTLALHTQEPGAPVQQEHTNLWEAQKMIIYVNLEQYQTIRLSFFVGRSSKINKLKQNKHYNN